MSHSWLSRPASARTLPCHNRKRRHKSDKVVDFAAQQLFGREKNKQKIKIKTKANINHNFLRQLQFPKNIRLLAKLVAT